MLLVGHYIASCETVYEFCFRIMLKRGALDVVILKVCTIVYALKHEKRSLKIILLGLAGSVGTACDF